MSEDLAMMWRKNFQENQDQGVAVSSSGIRGQKGIEEECTTRIEYKLPERADKG